MITEDIKTLIPMIANFLSGQPVKRAWLFGSCSRGEQTAESDVDILVEYDRSGKFSLFTISGMIVKLSRLLNRRVDMVEEGRLLPFAVASANRDKILIYERKD